MAKKITQAVIFAGGLGTRMRPLTDTMPKPMIPVQGRPFLEYLIELLRANGVTEVVMLLGYLPEKITEHFADGSAFGVHITYDITPVEYDTGTRLMHARALIKDRFLLMYCDNYWPLDLEKLTAFYEKQDVPASVVVFDNRTKTTKSNMFVDKDGFVKKYDRSRTDPDLNGVDIGFLILDKSVLDLAPEGDFHFEKEVFPKLIASRRLAGYLTGHQYYSLGSVERLPITEKFFERRKVMFLDRDGVVNARPPEGENVKQWKEFRFLPHAIEALKLLSDHGYELYVISNQPGIAKGTMTQEDLDDIDVRMKDELKKHGVILGGAYYCPHGAGGDCDCRKPKPGMILRAANEHYFDATRTMLIGDDPRDAEAAWAVGAEAVLMESNGDLLDVVKSIVRS
jgi:histidinol-phosphate phosphatase family protein